MRATQETKLSFSLGQLTFACLGLAVLAGFFGLRMLEVRDVKRLARDEQEQTKRRPQMRHF
jgi:hypothetical protein